MFEWLKKAPPPPPAGAVTRDIDESGCRVRLDLTPQVLALDIPEETTPFEDGEPLAAVPQAYGFVSASMLAIRAKLFDDGLYAAAELAAQERKAPLLRTLAAVAPVVAAAARLGGLDTPDSADAQRITRAFLASEIDSKPIGFYTWSDALRRVFQQDRLLQQELSAADAAALAAAVASEPAYGAYLDFVARLTNPLVPEKPDLLKPGGAFFFPPSRAHETDLIKRLHGNAPIPDGFSLADEMIQRLRAGTLDLAPTDASGWYDRQTWALEALVLLEKMPEGARLRINAGYRRQLDDLFKAILALTRETHAKQLEIPRAGCGPPGREIVLHVEPALTVEPLAGYYERRAQSYDFVRGVLESIAPLTSMRRVTAAGPVVRPLDEELAEIATVFRGAAAVARHELGMAVAGPDADVFRRAKHDADDVRMMVPVFFDRGRGKLKVWAVLGWATRTLHVSFAKPPVAHVLKGRARIEWSRAWRQIAYPVFAEAYVSRLLDRDEFRAHCDRHKTRGKIIENL